MKHQLKKPVVAGFD